MRRRQFLKASALGITATAVAMPAIAQTNPAIKWRLTSSFPKSLDVLDGVSQTIAKYVVEATDNQFQIQPFAAGEIVPTLQAMDAVSNGSVEALQLRHLHDQVAHPRLTLCRSLSPARDGVRSPAGQAWRCCARAGRSRRAPAITPANESELLPAGPSLVASFCVNTGDALRS
jgi:hypothetical protein